MLDCFLCVDDRGPYVLDYILCVDDRGPYVLDYILCVDRIRYVLDCILCVDDRVPYVLDCILCADHGVPSVDSSVGDSACHAGGGVGHGAERLVGGAAAVAE